MSNAQKAVDLLKTGPETIAELINMNNRTEYAVGDLVIGNPTTSADSDYNTDIEVTFPAPDGEPDPVTGQLHYSRLDLGRLFTGKNIRMVDNSYSSTHDLLAPMLDEARVLLEPEDIVDASISGAYPRTVILRASPTSLRFIGQFSVEVTEVITPDTSFITAPASSTGSPTLKALKSDGSLWYGEGLKAEQMLVAHNSEIEIAFAARMAGVPLVFAPNGSNAYAIDIADQSDWYLPFSIQLISKRNGARITDLYDVSLKVTAPGGGVLDFDLVRQYGRLVLKDTANNLTVENQNAYPESQALYQSTLRIADHKSKLGTLPLNAAGHPYGTYAVELKAVRKGGGQADVVRTSSVVITGTPAP